MTKFLLTAAVITGLLAALANLVRRKWLFNILALAIQYVCIFIVFPKTDGFMHALIKVIVGLMSTLIIFLTIQSTGAVKREPFEFKLSAGELFRMLSAVFLVTLVVLASPWLLKEVFPQSNIYVLILSLGLALIGLLQLGSKTESLYVIIGLLTFLSGFELLYGSLEFSALLEALFAIVNLLIAIAGAFFIVKDLETETP